MVKKRNVFDIDFDPETEAEVAPETKSFRAVQGHPLQNAAVTETELTAERRGPMASAISETAEATAERAATEAAIRAENDALAHEHVRLKKLGLITDLIPTRDVLVSKLTRDRSENADPELDELKLSIREVGLSNPIRVEKTEAGFELIQGFRRLSAFRALEEETGDPRYSRIPASLVPRGEPLVDLYRKMVDENLVRKDLSFAEMAQLGLSYAQAEGIEPREAVRTLYASALKQKRAYIQAFAVLLGRLPGVLRHPEAIPRALGLDLNKALERAPELVREIKERLATVDVQDAEAEVQVLRDALVGMDQVQKPGDGAGHRGKKTVSKTSLRMIRSEGEARVTASDGRIELRLNRDFSAVPKEDLQKAVEALFDSLDAK